ncbi:hypothetical protein D9M69_638690 [compost metagenome]
MSTDRELLELAAKAAGIGPVLCYETSRNCLRIGDRKSYRLWRPLTFGGDTLQLAGKMKFTLDFENGTVWGAGDLDMTALGKTSDKQPCMKRAIVRAAAEIGRSMP